MGENENARKDDETLRAQLPQPAKSMARSFDRNDAAAGAASKPSSDLDLLSASGYAMVLLGVKTKVPCELNWISKRPDNEMVRAKALRNGNNIGVRLGPCDLVVDVDPRSGGDESLARLVFDVGLELGHYPRVRTGGEPTGLHIYMRRPMDFACVGKLPSYPGIDFKTKGHVVAPGSTHPDTGRVYVGEDLWLLALDVPAPPKLLEMLLKPDSATASSSELGGELTPAMLAANLALLDPEEFGRGAHDEWLALMQSCHHATCGEGKDQFIEWSTRAAGYADHSEIIGNRWDSLSVNGQGVTVRSLFKLLHDRGLVPFDRSEPEDDFDLVDIEPAKADGRWRFLSVQELESLPPPRWLVHGLLTEGSLAAIYGAPESGKSFLAVDLSMSIGSAIPWHGREVMAGGVLYIAAEGAPGLGKRVRAWKLDKGASDRPIGFSLMRDPINLTTEKEARDFTRAVTAALGELRLIVIDTLNQTAAGADENSAMDMGRYIASMKLLRDASGATVVVVHHSGKDESKGMRGSTSLLGAMDTTIEVKRATDGRSVEVRVQKQKDAEKESPIRFNLEKVAGSLVLRPTVIADAASDFACDPIVEMARELAERSGGQVGLKTLVTAIMERDGVSDKTARRRIDDSMREGRENAKRAGDQTLLWIERIDNNPRGEKIIRSETTECAR